MFTITWNNAAPVERGGNTNTFSFPYTQPKPTKGASYDPQTGHCFYNDIFDSYRTFTASGATLGEATLALTEQIKAGLSTEQDKSIKKLLATFDK